jgi:hypothetical protein
MSRSKLSWRTREAKYALGSSSSAQARMSHRRAMMNENSRKHPIYMFPFGSSCGGPDDLRARRTRALLDRRYRRVPDGVAIPSALPPDVREAPANRLPGVGAVSFGFTTSSPMMTT